MMDALKHYAEVYRIQFKNNWVREAVYRTNFVTSLAVDMIWIGVEFSLFSVIYANVPVLAGWTQPQVYFFLGVFFASDALFTILFQRNLWVFSDLVNKGELDILLTKPINPLFLALTRWISLTSVFNFALGIGIAAWYADTAGFAGGWHWLLMIFWLAVGVVTAVLVRFLFSVWVFWTDRGWAMARLYYQFFSFASKPDILFPKMIRYVILTALPFAFIGSVPARALLKGLTPTEYLLVAVVLTVFFVVDQILWRKGLRRYQSASS